MADSFFRVQKTQDFTVMSNHHLKNPQLSLKAKGLLSFILSLPNDWDLSVRGLQKFTKEGYESLANTLRELVKFGYIVRKQIQNEKGQFTGYCYEVHELPVIRKTEEKVAESTDFTDNRKGKKPDTENPFTDNPFTEKPKQLNTNNTNILNINNTKGVNTKSLSSIVSTNLVDNDSSENESATAAYERLISNFFPNDVNSSFGKYFIDMWYRRGYSLDLIEEAIKDNLFRGNNLQIKHVDDTLTAWMERGITTALEAKKQIKQNREANKSKKSKLNDIDSDDEEENNSIEIDGYTLPAIVNSELTDGFKFFQFCKDLSVPEIVMRKYEVYQFFTMLDESFDRNDCFDLFNFFMGRCSYDVNDISQYGPIASIIGEILVKYTSRKNDIKSENSKRSYIKTMIENINWMKEKKEYDAI